MKTIDRYLVSELMVPFGLGIAGFVIIMTTDLLFTFVDMIINKGVPVIAIIRLILYKLPAIMVLTFPVSFLFASAIALGRLARDSELNALRTSGVSFFRISVPFIIASLVVSLAAFVTNEELVPRANRVSNSIIRQIIYKEPLMDIKEQVFFRDNSNRFFYVRRVTPGSGFLEDIMIYELMQGQFPRVITAKTAVSGDGIWTLKHGVIHAFDGNGSMKYAADFKDMKISVKENISMFSEQKTPDQMNSRELGSLISSLKSGGINTNALSTDFLMKFSIPITTFIFALLAIPLSIPAQKAGKSWGFALSVMIVFTFYVLASVSRSLGRGGMVPPWAAAFLPGMITSLLGSALIFRESRR